MDGGALSPGSGNLPGDGDTLFDTLLTQGRGKPSHPSLIELLLINQLIQMTQLLVDGDCLVEHASPYPCAKDFSINSRIEEA